jgi:hypothetical protein
MLGTYNQPGQRNDPEVRSDCEPGSSTSSSTRRRPPPQFFVNSSHVSPAPQTSFDEEGHPISFSSLPSSPGYSRKTSRASLAALRSALKHYQISPEDESRPIFASGHERPVTLSHDDRMDALVEIHRVLYRGREDLDDRALNWNEQGQEVKRVVERWFEADCSE